MGENSFAVKDRTGPNSLNLGNQAGLLPFRFSFEKAIFSHSFICKCKGEAVWVQLLSTGRERGWERGLNSIFISLCTARKYRARALLLGRFRNEENMNHFSPEMWQV